METNAQIFINMMAGEADDLKAKLAEIDKSSLPQEEKDKLKDLYGKKIASLNKKIDEFVYESNNPVKAKVFKYTKFVLGVFGLGTAVYFGGRYGWSKFRPNSVDSVSEDME